MFGVGFRCVNFWGGLIVSRYHRLSKVPDSTYRLVLCQFVRWHSIDTSVRCLLLQLFRDDEEFFVLLLFTCPRAYSRG